jgi:transcriptional regulator with XRE-family HTH domain
MNVMPSELQKTFGKRVRDRRGELGWTQAELARRLGIHQPDLCDLEKGRHAPTLETVEKIAGVLGISPSSLML